MTEKKLEFIKEVVNYFNTNRSTMRKTAKHFGISKTTVHKYITKVMPNSISEEIILTNISERAFRAAKASALARNKHS